MISFTFDTSEIGGKVNSTVGYFNTIARIVKSGSGVEIVAAEIIIKNFKRHIDMLAQTDPTLHHAYESGRAGISDARLFDLRAVPNNANVIIELFFLENTQDIDGHVFVHRAEVLEEGMGMVIEPVSSSVLYFEYEGNSIFTSKAVIEARSQSTTGRLQQEFDVYMASMATIDLEESGFITSLNRMLQQEVDAFSRNVSKNMTANTASSAAYSTMNKVKEGLRRFARL